MNNLLMSFLACVLIASVAPTTKAEPASSPSGKYNILGLTLGMTAKQAEALLSQRLHVSPGDGSCSVGPEPGVYVPGRPFVRVILVRTRNAKLSLFFIEVPRGGGQGPEELWSIDYVPVAPTTADKAALIAHIHRKFGPPTKVFDQQIEFWANKNYVTVHDFDRPSIAVLNLITYSGELTLKNIGILIHMQSVFDSRRTPQS